MNYCSSPHNKKTGFLTTGLQSQQWRYLCFRKHATTIIQMLSNVYLTCHPSRSFQINWSFWISKTINWMIHGCSKPNNVIPWDIQSKQSTVTAWSISLKSSINRINNRRYKSLQHWYNQQSDDTTWCLDIQAYNAYMTHQYTQDSTILAYMHYVNSTNALRTAVCTRTMEDHMVTC